MFSYYITADTVGLVSGGGVVTKNECEALTEFCGRPPIVLDAKTFGQYEDPFVIDALILKHVQTFIAMPTLVHIYSGTFSKTVRWLRSQGVYVSYTSAAHDPELSKQEFELLGVPYNYKHLTDPILWNDYVAGYREANDVITPSNASKKILERFGCKACTVIAHGADTPSRVDPLPRFCVGYLGQTGPDKGIPYLLSAWRVLGSKNSRLILSGRDMPAILNWVRQIGGGNVEIRGFTKDVSDFYNDCAVYCQPSVTEGFGIGVLEAMSHGRPCVVSDGAGAADVVEDGKNGFIVPKRDVKMLAIRLAELSLDKGFLQTMGFNAMETAKAYTWNKIRSRYVNFWHNRVG